MNKSVLIIGTDTNMLNTLEFLLESENLKVCTSFCDVKNIMETGCNGDKIGIVLADTLSSARKCSALIESVKKENGEIPLIVLTGIFERGKTLNSEKNFNVKYIEKPFTVCSLIETVKEILDGNSKL